MDGFCKEVELARWGSDSFINVVTLSSFLKYQSNADAIYIYKLFYVTS